MKKAAKFLRSDFRLDIRLPAAQGSDLGDPTNCEGGFVLGKLNIAHGFPVIT